MHVHQQKPRAATAAKYLAAAKKKNKLEPLMSAGMELLLQEFPAIFLKNEWKQQQREIFW